MALTLANMAISELKILWDFEEEDTAKMLGGPPFQSYALALQYMFFMEITKLLERPNKIFPTNHEASIEKAGEAILKKGFNEYSDKHSYVVENLNSIRESEFFKKLKTLRDKKFAHADGDLNFDPMKIPILKSEEISECMNLLVVLFDIWKQITTALDYDFESRVPFMMLGQGIF
jgi:hypothetical protein